MMPSEQILKSAVETYGKKLTDAQLIFAILAYLDEQHDRDDNATRMSKVLDGCHSGGGSL